MFVRYRLIEGWLAGDGSGFFVFYRLSRGRGLRGLFLFVCIRPAIVRFSYPDICKDLCLKVADAVVQCAEEKYGIP